MTNNKALQIFLLALFVLGFILVIIGGGISGNAVGSPISLSMQIILPESSRMIEPGGELLINTRIFKAGDDEIKDILLETYAEDPTGKTFSKSTQTFAIGTQVNIVDSIYIPIDAPLGKYTVKERVEYSPEVNASASAEFLVIEKGELKKTNLVFAGIAIIITILLLIVILLIVIYKKIKERE